MSSTAEWGGVDELAGVLNVRIGAWNHFGYVNPPAPNCKTIPPLGERSAAAIKAGHGAVEVVDEIIRELYDVRAQLVDELRDDADKRAVRVDGGDRS